MNKIEILNFPVILFKEAYVHFARNEDELTSCNNIGLKNGFYDGLVIVDSKGKMFRLKSAKKIGTIGPFWGLNIFLEQKFRVEFVFDDFENEIELDKFKEKIFRVVRNDMYFWSSSGDFEQIKQIISGSQSVGEIIEFLTERFFRQYK